MQADKYWEELPSRFGTFQPPMKVEEKKLKRLKSDDVLEEAVHSSFVENNYASWYPDVCFKVSCNT